MAGRIAKRQRLPSQRSGRGKRQDWHEQDRQRGHVTVHFPDAEEEQRLERRERHTAQAEQHTLAKRAFGRRRAAATQHEEAEDDGAAHLAIRGEDDG
eukprot:6495773-Prymnesium_polylepis.1